MIRPEAGSGLLGGVLRAFAVLALACTLGACRSPEEQVEAHLGKAKTLLAAGDQGAAWLELQDALRVAPRRADLDLRIARLLTTNPAWAADALFLYQEAYQLDPSLDEARLGAAEILAVSERGQARALVEEVLARDPANARAHGLMSRLALLDSDLAGGLASARTAVELAPDDAETQLRLGRAYQARIQVAQQAARLPEDAVFQGAADAFARAAASSEQAGDLERHIMAVFERARVLAAWPGHRADATAAYLSLIDLAGRGGDAARVRAASETAFSFAVATNDDGVIHEVLERIVERDPSNLVAWGALATHERRLGRSDDAVYARMLAKQPRVSAAHMIRAEALVERGDLAGAVAALEAAVGQVDDPTAAQLALAELLYRAGRAADAGALVERMQAASPEDPNVRLAGALRAMREDRLEDAVRELDAVTAGAESLRALEMLAEAHLRLGNVAAAKEAVDRGARIARGGWPAGQALRLAIQRASRDWAGLLSSAKALEESGRALDAEQQLAVIEALYETDRASEARKRLDALLTSSSASPAARLLYAQREGAADPARARRFLEEGLAADPDAQALLQQLVVFDVAAGRREEGLARLDDYLERRAPGDAPGLRLLRARFRAQAGDPAGAEQDALEGFRAAPGIPGAAELVAGLYAQQGRSADAITAFEGVLADGSLPPAARSVLARLYAAEGRDEDAIRTLEEVVQDGGGAPAKNELARLLARDQRDLERALTLAQEAVASGAEQPTYSDTLGSVYLQKGLHAAALEQFDRAIELARRQGGPRAEYLFRKGLALQGLGRPAEAVNAFEAALSLDPAFDEAGEARASLEEARAAAEGAGPS